jgi:hypothetical protein
VDNRNFASTTTAEIKMSKHLLQEDRPECASPANPVVAENCRPGTTDWIVKKFSPNLTGYASPNTINIGESVNLFVTSQAPDVSISIYRSGYYQGMGGRLITTLQKVPGKVQPDCRHDLETGLASCTNWTPSTSVNIPTDWVSGVYIVKLSDSTGENFLEFTVRDDARKSDILFQQSWFTYQAYNDYGGKSIYNFNSGTTCPINLGTVRAVKVSLNRPITTGDMTYAAAGSGYFRVEYAMVRWLEQQGYDVTYSTTMDTHNSGKQGAHNKLLDHKVFASVGHDEYWTQEMRDAITAARDAGVHIVFFSGNTAYWRVRLEADPYISEPDAVMVNYKTIEDGPEDPNATKTSTFRDQKQVNDPENSLMGTQYIGDNDGLFFPLQVTAEQVADPIYRFTGLQAMAPKTYARFGDQVVGWEWQAVVDNGHSPAGVTVLASSPVFGNLLRDDGNAKNNNLGTAVTEMTRYTAPSGAIVFSTGTILWAWGLGAKGIEITPIDPIIQQVTYNILDDMHVRPATPVNAIILDEKDAQNKKITPINNALHENAVPVISNIQPAVNGPNITITWDTNTPTNGQVWFGSDADHTSINTTPLEDFTQQHTFKTDFDYGMTLYFRIGVTDRDGRITISDVNSLRTANAPLTTWVKSTAKTALTNGRCWVQASPVRAAGVGGLVVVIAAVLGVGTVRFVRRRHRA